MSVKDYQSESFVRVRINKSELLMLSQLLEKCKPASDLSDFHGERHAVCMQGLAVIENYGKMLKLPQ